MDNLDNIKFLKTDDNSTGLYSENVKDIFHSKCGALTEANEKFIEPIKILVQRKSELNVLDICFGIGYNSKALLHSYPQIKINIDALEYNLNYILLSPFIKDCIDDISLRYFLLKKIEINLNTNLDFYTSLLLEVQNQNKEFFDSSISFFDRFISKSPYTFNLTSQNNCFLHNIYYEYISNRPMYSIDLNKFCNSSINFHIGDGRKTIKFCNKKYDVVFLDAFSSQKDPTLWTIDFLRLISQRINENGILVSYSKATPFRSALKELGFCVGKTYINNVDMGTVASFDKDNITNYLTDYDIQLIKTRSGITYKDSLLSLSPNDILLQREIEQKNSSLISHTQFLKFYKK